MNDQTPDNRIKSEMIFITSIVSGRTYEPLIQMEWGNEAGQLDLDEARQHALGILEACEAAESDAFVFKWLTRDIIGTNEDEAENFRRIIAEFKEFREARKALPKF